MANDIANSGCAFKTEGLIRDKWQQLGGENGFLGCPLMNETPTRDTVGRYNDFVGGSIYWHSRTGAFETHGAIRDKWRKLDAEMGLLGYPVTDETPSTDGGGRYNHFERGSIYWYPRTGAFEVHGAIRDKWNKLGAETGPLHYPITDETAALDGEGRYNHFEGGSIYWHSRTGAFLVTGLIRDKWISLGAETGRLKYPMSDELPTADGTGRYNYFERGAIYWHPRTGTFFVSGRIREKWLMYGGEQNFLGYPTSDPVTAGQHITQQFEGGTINHDTTTGAVKVSRKASATFPRYAVEIHVIRARDSNGQRETIISDQEIQKWVDGANMIFEVAGIQFHYNGSNEIIYDTDVNSTRTEEPQWNVAKQKINQIAERERKVVVLFRYGPDAFPTGNGFSWSDLDFVVMPQYGTNDWCNQENIGFLAHEIGHFLGLPHTMPRVFKRTGEALEFFLNNERNLTDLTQAHFELKIPRCPLPQYFSPIFGRVSVDEGMVGLVSNHKCLRKVRFKYF